jgi:RNA polymerase sigma-70 factor, ECF subfamily
MTQQGTTAATTAQEAIFVAGLRAQDQQVFAQMYQQFSPPLFSFILGKVKDTEVAENLLQDVFLKTWKHHAQYDAAKGRLFIWMYKICSNTCIDYLRSKQHRVSRQSVLGGYLPENPSCQASGAASPDRIGLKKLVGQLRDEEREILELLYFKGYTQAEVAGLKGIPLGTVKTRCSKAIKKLRSFFEYRQSLVFEPVVQLAV